MAGKLGQAFGAARDVVGEGPDPTLFGSFQDASGFGARASSAGGAASGGGIRALNAGLGGAEQARAQQQTLAGQLARSAAGLGPSLAEMQTRQGFEQAINAQAAMAGGQRGNPALAQRIAAGQSAQLLGQGAQAAGMARLAEQQQAQQALAGLLGTQRQQDLGTAGLAQGLIGTGVQAQLGAGGLSAGLAGQQLAAAQGTQQATTQVGLAERQAQAEELARRQQMIMQGVGMGLQTFGGLAGLSDRRSKRDVAPASSSDVRRTLRSLRPSRYKYRAEHEAEGGSGERIGIMAQDLERTDLGRSLVREGPDGLKRIDVAGLVGTLAASVADQQARLDRMESKRRA